MSPGTRCERAFPAHENPLAKHRVRGKLEFVSQPVFQVRDFRDPFGPDGFAVHGDPGRQGHVRVLAKVHAPLLFDQRSYSAQIPASPLKDDRPAFGFLSAEY